MIFERTHFAEGGDEAGVFIDALGSALVTWVAMIDRSPTVREAATMWNTTPEVIREAVEGAMWICLDGRPDDDLDKRRLVLGGA